MFVSNYDWAAEFTKKGNLIPYYQAKGYTLEDAKRCGGREREISLFVLARHDADGVWFRIKCPVNPLPIKGEFQCTSFRDLAYMLGSMGWAYKGNLPVHILR